MRVPAVMLLLVVASATARSAQQDQAASCKSSGECSQLAAEALARSDFEQGHDLAWRAMQLARRNDTDVMFLLARTQSLIGRPQDALVMLHRLAALGFRSDEIETHEDFLRVRSLPQWADLLAALRKTGAPPPGARTEPAGPAARTAPAARGTPGTTGTLPAPDAPAVVREKSEPSSGGSPTGLRVPLTPLALAYDAVSDRFVVVDDSSDTLKVVDERTGNVIDLVGRGWAGAYRPVALAIDPRRGDLWAAGIDMTSGAPRSALYKLQLVSGRLLQTIQLPEDSGPARVVDIAIGRDTIFFLDAAGKRVFSLRDGARTTRVVANLSSIPDPVSLAAAGDERIYIAHAKGLARVDLNGRTRLPTPVPAAAKLTDLQSISWHDGSLFAVQRTGAGHTIARIQLDARGTTATSLKSLGPAAARAAAVYGDFFYYVAADGDGGVILRGARVR